MPITPLLLLAGFAAAAPPTGTVAPVASLAVASVNVWGVPNVVHPLHSNQSRLRGALGEYLSHTERFDVVAVQEVWREMWRPDQRKDDLLAGWLGVLPTWLGGSETGLGFAGSAERWARVAEPDQHPFADRGRSFDRWKHKGFATCELRTTGVGGEAVEVVVVNTHLQAANLFAPKADAKVRHAQVKETLAALAAEARPVVWIGDFNFAEGEGSAGAVDLASIAAVRAAGFAEGADFFPELRAHPSNVDGRRYDRVWVRGSERYDLAVTAAAAHVHGGDVRRRSVVKQLSDHLPLEVAISVLRRGE